MSRSWVVIYERSDDGPACFSRPCQSMNDDADFRKSLPSMYEEPRADQAPRLSITLSFSSSRRREFHYAVASAPVSCSGAADFLFLIFFLILAPLPTTHPGRDASSRRGNPGIFFLSNSFLGSITAKRILDQHVAKSPAISPSFGFPPPPLPPHFAPAIPTPTPCPSGSSRTADRGIRPSRHPGRRSAAAAAATERFREKMQKKKKKERGCE